MQHRVTITIEVDYDDYDTQAEKGIEEALEDIQGSNDNEGSKFEDAAYNWNWTKVFD